jgi:CO/xanthine dehydrogenase Mo-binding subunit
MYVAFGYSAQRAVVDVDPELGLVRVVQVASVQDVGTVGEPAQLLGQVEGGIVQGVGMVTMEEVVVTGGVIANPDLQGYVVPTLVDAPDGGLGVRRGAEPRLPYGWKGAGEPPLCAACPPSPPRSGTPPGSRSRASPIRPEHIALGVRP